MNVFNSEKPLWEVKKMLDASIAGLEREKLSAFVALFSYKMPKPLHTAIIGESSVGKSHLLANVLSFFPIATPKQVKDFYSLLEQRKEKWTPESYEEATMQFWRMFDGVCLTGVSAKAFNRYNADLKDFSWDGKILGLMELDGVAEAEPVIRIMMSEGTASTIVTEASGGGKHYARLWVVNGTPAFVVTSASRSLEDQFANRCFIIEVPTEKSYLKKVHKMIAQNFKLGVESPILSEEGALFKREVKAFASKAGSVKVPFADLVEAAWYSEQPSSNRVLKDFLKFVQVIALIHQAGRSVDSGGSLIATPDDYEIARSIFCTQKHKLAAPVLKTFRAVQLLDAKGVGSSTLDELTEAAGKSERQVRMDLLQLEDKGIIHSSPQYETTEYGRLQRKPTLYSLTIFGRTGLLLPSWTELSGSGEGLVSAYDPLSGESLVRASLTDVKG